MDILWLASRCLHLALLQFTLDLVDKVSRFAARTPYMVFAWGRILRILVCNWAYLECDLVFDALLRRLVVSLSERSGQALELPDAGLVANSAALLPLLPVGGTAWDWEIRLFFRGLLLDPEMTPRHDMGPILEQRPPPHPRSSTMRNGAYWVLRSIEGLENVQKGSAARLLFLLYGPLAHADNRIAPEIQQRCLCTNPVTSLHDAQQLLGPLAWALESVAVHGNTIFRAAPPGTKAAENFLRFRLQRRNMSPLSLFGLVEELTTFPEPWALDSFTGLLLLAPKLAAIVLSLRVVHNSIPEAAALAGSAKTIAFRWRIPDRFLQILQGTLTHVVSRVLRRRFLFALSSASADRMAEIASFPHAPNYRLEMQEEIAAQEAFQPHLHALIRDNM